MWGFAHIGYGATLEILRFLIDGAGESGHGVHCAGCVQDIDILTEM